MCNDKPWAFTFKGQGWRWWRRNVNAVDMNSTVFVTDFITWIYVCLSLKKRKFCFTGFFRRETNGVLTSVDGGVSDTSIDEVLASESFGELSASGSFGELSTSISWSDMTKISLTGFFYFKST